MPPNPPPDLAAWLAVLDERTRQLETNLSVLARAGAQLGTATLVAGTVVVASTIVTASSRIFLTSQVNGVTGALRVSARSAGVSFTITSSVAGDAGLVAWRLFEPI